MTLGSTTANLHMINIAVTAADGSGQVWQDPKQMIPLGMNGNPEAFVAAIKAGLPLVNTLRVHFNAFSFNADGSMHPQFERFLTAAAAAGYHIVPSYGSGDNQNLGIGDADHPFLTNAEAYDALQADFVDVQGAWTSLLDWMATHPDVAGAVYGWDLMNEPAGYRHTVRANGTEGDLGADDFVGLYAEHSADLAQMIQTRTEGKILVGGWGYNGDFLTLANTTVHGVSALQYLRGAVGDDLVWSAHLYPGWMGTNLVADPDALVARLDQIYAALTGDDLLITEFNIDSTVDDADQPDDYTDLFATSLDWFADNGVGLGWFPGLQTGASHLLYVEGDGAITLRHQHSFAAAMNAYALGADLTRPVTDQRLSATLVEANLRNEPYEMAAGEGLFDAATRMGTGFGFGGADTLLGSAGSNDFLYGGSGDDVVRSTGGDDFLFGQGDDDVLIGGSGIDHLFGGTGNDTLNAGGGRNVMAGGRGDDLFLVRSLDDIVKEFIAGGDDSVHTTLRSLSLSTGAATQYTHVENLAYIGQADFRGNGNALANQISGGAGADTLAGEGGRDTLTGGGGDDRLSGGADGDRFVFAAGAGHDVVLDFAGSDTLVFQNLSGIRTVAEAMAHARQIGADVQFDFGPADSLILHDTSLATLAQDILVT